MKDTLRGRTWAGAAAGLVSLLPVAGCQTTTPSHELRPLPPLTAARSGESAFQDEGAASTSASPTPPSKESSTRREGGEIVQVSATSPAGANGSAPAQLPAPQKISVAAGSPAMMVGDATENAQAAPLALTLPTAVAQALLANPDLVALRGQENVSQAAVGTARVYPWNPFVQAQAFPNGHPHVPSPEPGGSSGLSNYYVWMMQRFEIPQKRRLRTQGALATLTQTQWNIYQGELLNTAQTLRLYFAALYQRELHELAVETAKLNQQLQAVVEQRYRANLARAADVTTATIAARQAVRQADLAQATYMAAVLALRQQLNVPVTTPLVLGDRLTQFRWLHFQAGAGADPGPCPRGDPLAELIEGRPDVMAARAGVQLTEANYRLARANMVQDISGGPIFETADDGTRYWGLRLQMDLPFANTGAPLARQRRAEFAQQQLTYDQLKVRAVREAQTTIDRYERALGLTEKATANLPALSGGMPPELKAISEQFQAGQADILAVLTTQNNLIQERRVYLDLLNELAQSAAAVVQATALPPDHLVNLSVGDSPHRDAP